MCQHLAGIEVSSPTDPNSTTNFRKLLLKKCQREFANTVAELVDIEKKKKEVEDINDVWFLISFSLDLFIADLFECRNRRKKCWKISLVRKLLKRERNV